MIWKRAVTLQALNAMSEGNMVGLLDIQFTRIGENELEATMPVDSRTHQPFGLLHGGASVVLAETLDLSVNAEGVELQAQADFLAHLGCHANQGYLFGRPVPLAELEARVRGQ